MVVSVEIASLFSHVLLWLACESHRILPASCCSFWSPILLQINELHCVNIDIYGTTQVFSPYSSDLSHPCLIHPGDSQARLALSFDLRPHALIPRTIFYALLEILRLRFLVFPALVKLNEGTEGTLLGLMPVECRSIGQKKFT